MADEIPPPEKHPEDPMLRALELLPWLKHLPEDERREVFVDMVSSVQQSLTLDVGDERTIERLVVELSSWKATAEVHADPELYAALTAPSGSEDFVEAPRPMPPVGEPRVEPKRRCGASLPHENADNGWRWCGLAAGHSEPHMDPEDRLYAWEDGKTVEVHTVEDVRAIPHHVHDFVGDEDTCVRERGCQLTWGESCGQQREWEMKIKIQKEVLQVFDIPEHKVRSPRPLCPSHIPSGDDRADWCMLSAGHTPDHRSREGRTWTDADEQNARSLAHVIRDAEIKDEIARIPAPREATDE